MIHFLIYQTPRVVLFYFFRCRFSAQSSFLFVSRPAASFFFDMLSNWQLMCYKLLHAGINISTVKCLHHLHNATCYYCFIIQPCHLGPITSQHDMKMVLLNVPWGGYLSRGLTAMNKAKNNYALRGRIKILATRFF